MKCIAESGSTKTTWVVIDQSGKELHRSSTQGLNPFFVESAEVTEAFQNAVPVHLRQRIKNLYFYGSGCSSEQRKQRIRDGILDVAAIENLQVEHDLLAAARATCKIASGIACILGTGSNSCEYDGKNIIDNIHALGFMIGDEGSGTDIGRRLLQAWVYREMSSGLSTAFEKEFEITLESVLQNIYYQPKPNKYLASFAKFCSLNREDVLIKQIIRSALEGFVVRHVMKYGSAQKVPIHFVGSIAYNFKAELDEILNHHGLTLGLVIAAPIEELIHYHASHEV
jgi:glucosamine kinase